MTSILSRDPNQPPCPVCGEGGEHYRQFGLTHDAHEVRRNLQSLASENWFPTASDLQDRASLCFGCRAHLQQICSEFDEARSLAAVANLLNPGDENIQTLCDQVLPYGVAIDEQLCFRRLCEVAFDDVPVITPKELARLG